MTSAGELADPSLQTCTRDNGGLAVRLLPFAREARVRCRHANDCYLQPRAVRSHTFSGIIWHCATEINSSLIQLHDSFVMVPLNGISLHLHLYDHWQLDWLYMSNTIQWRLNQICAIHYSEFRPQIGRQEDIKWKYEVIGGTVALVPMFLLPQSGCSISILIQFIYIISSI